MYICNVFIFIVGCAYLINSNVLITYRFYYFMQVKRGYQQVAYCTTRMISWRVMAWHRLKPNIWNLTTSFVEAIQNSGRMRQNPVENFHYMNLKSGISKYIYWWNWTITLWSGYIHKTRLQIPWLGKSVYNILHRVKFVIWYTNTRKVSKLVLYMKVNY